MDKDEARKMWLEAGSAEWTGRNTGQDASVTAAARWPPVRGASCVHLCVSDTVKSRFIFNQQIGDAVNSLGLHLDRGQGVGGRAHDPRARTFSPLARPHPATLDVPQAMTTSLRSSDLEDVTGQDAERCFLSRLQWLFLCVRFLWPLRGDQLFVSAVCALLGVKARRVQVPGAGLSETCPPSLPPLTPSGKNYTECVGQGRATHKIIPISFCLFI